MSTSRSTRTAFARALFGLATLSIAACSGGATTGAGGGAIPLGAGSGSGGGATAAPSTAATASATSSPMSSPTSGGGGSTTAPTSGPSAGATATPASLDSLSIVPAVLDGDLGGVAQIGIIDPNYTGAYSVSVSGSGILSSVLNTFANVTNGTLQGTQGGATILSLNLANAVQLGLLGPGGNAVTICEQQNPTTCKQVNISNNGVVPMVGSTLDSIVLSPSGFQAFGLIAPGLSYTNFNVVSTPNGISVTNLGNGQYTVSAAATVSPLSGNIVISDGMGHTVTIPIAVP